jgi:hypothetical protein
VRQQLLHKRSFSRRLRSPLARSLGRGLPAALVACILAGWPFSLAWGAFHFTPFVRAELGYDDNVRLKQQARGDFFITAKPGFSLEWAEPTSKLSLQGDISYSEYYRLSEYTQVDGGNGSLSWDYTPSPLWKFQVYDKYSSTYDPPEVDENGRLVYVRSDSGRRDRNLAGLTLRRNFGPDSFVGGFLRSSQDTYSSDAVGNSQRYEGGLSAGHRLGPDWRLEAGGSYYYNDYEHSEDINQTQGTASLVRMLGPNRSAMLTLGYTQVRAETDNPLVRQARDYEVYRAGLGYSHKVSPTFQWNASVGWAQVDGDHQANQAAGNGYPTFSADISWSGQRWRFTMNAYSSLGEQEVIGENLGLTLAHGAGMGYSYDLAKHWRITANVSYVHNDYKQDPALAGLQPGQDTDSWVAGLMLSWQFARRASLALNYRYLTRDSQNDADDRSQNRIFLVLTYEHPYRW